MEGLMLGPHFTFGTTIGTSMGIFGQELIQDGISGSLVTQGGIIGAGVAVFLYQEKKHNTLRREADQRVQDDENKKDKRIEQLEQEVRSLYERIAKHESEE